MTKLNGLFCLIFTFSLIGFRAVSQQYNFKNFNVEDGLAQSQVYSIAQDDFGYLWLATKGGGINKFNGLEFTTLTTKNKLPSNYINKLLKDKNGLLWVATAYGVGYFKNDVYVDISLKPTKRISVNDLFLTENNLIICATNEGLFEIRNFKPTQIGSQQSAMNVPFQTAIKTRQGNYFMGSDKGFFQYSNTGHFVSFKMDHRVMGNSITIVRQDNTGTVWIGTYGDGIYRYNGIDFRRIDYKGELYKQTILDIYCEESEISMATLNSGVIQYDLRTKQFQTISENQGLANNHVRCVFKDKANDFWFGTSGGGISHYFGKQFTHYDQSTGLAGNFIYSVYRDSKQRLWVGNSQQGVSVITNDGIQKFNADNGFQNTKVKAITEDKEGNIYLGTDGIGVFIYRNEKFEFIEDLAKAYVKHMATDKDGNVWVATAGSGVLKIESNRTNFIVSKWLVSDGMPSNRITSLHIDKKNRVWFGTESHGVGCISNNKVSTIHLTTQTGLSSPLIRCLTEDQFGRLWIGTAGGGINSYELYAESSKLKTYNIEQGLISANIYLITCDRSGQLIVGSEQGFDYVYFNENKQIKRIKYYGKADGFIGIETCQNSVFNDNDGAVWIGTIGGLCKFSPSALRQNTLAPLLSFIDIKLFYEPIFDSKMIQTLGGKKLKTNLFTYDQNHLTFEFFGVNLKRPDGVRYQWKLSGFDENWSPASKDRSILYSNLNPGVYQFMVRSCNEDGVWNTEPLIFKFEITAPFWQRTWFIVLIVLLILLILMLIYFLSIRRIRKKAKEKQFQVEMEKNLLELEQKALRLQMNPHFIFNALNSIQSLIGTGKEVEARYYLAKFSRLMREILDNSRKSEISLQEEIQTLQNYLLVEQFCTNNRFEYQIDVDQNSEPDFVKLPPMLIQPFVENAIKHGMKGREEGNPGFISISFMEGKSSLICTISDNGIGRKKAAEINDKSMETYHESASLNVTKERLQSLMNEHVSGSLEIIDLYDESNNPVGTKIIISIPL